MAYELTDAEEQLLKEVNEKFETSEKYLKPFRERADYLYSLYTTHRRTMRAARVSPPDRDTIIRDYKRDWGAELHIPIAFHSVETILPRAVSNRPRMLVLPKDEASEQNVKNMRALLDEQQRRVQYEMKLEETAKAGFIYGLGIQKIYWEEKWRVDRRLEPSITGTFWVEGNPQKRKVVDDWAVEDIDIADAYWDPFCSDMRGCRYFIHRIWLSTAEVMERLKAGKWNTLAAKQLTQEDLRSGSSEAKWDEAFKARMEAAGNTDTGKKDLHEILEFHDGEKVVTILNRKCPVQVGWNPAWHGELPFHVFRPTTAGVKQLQGIGIIEPIEHLIREMDTLRSQRRDNATLALMQTFAYQDGLIERKNIKMGPGWLIPVAGDPNEVIKQILVKDIPHSSYQEEANLTQDIERATGISDTVTGADASGAAAQTATGVQLVQAAASIRIQRQTRRLEVELVMPETRQAIAMNQQRITEERTVRVPEAPEPGQFAPAWQFVRLGPGELMGLFEIDAEGGSTGPANIPQKRQDAQMWTMFENNPLIDQRRVLIKKLELMDVPFPESWVAEQPMIPAQTVEAIGQLLVQNGIPEEAVGQIIEAAMQEAGQQPQQQPSMNGSGPAPEESPVG